MTLDIVTRLRQTRANMIGTDDEQHYWDCHDAANLIERMRLTDDERFILQSVRITFSLADSPRATVIDGLLKRLG